MHLQDVAFAPPDTAVDPDEAAAALLLRDLHASLLRVIEGGYPKALMKGRQPDAGSYAPADGRAER